MFRLRPTEAGEFELVSYTQDTVASEFDNFEAGLIESSSIAFSKDGLFAYVTTDEIYTANSSWTGLMSNKAVSRGMGGGMAAIGLIQDIIDFSISVRFQFFGLPVTNNKPLVMNRIPKLC